MSSMHAKIVSLRIECQEKALRPRPDMQGQQIPPIEQTLQRP